MSVRTLFADTFYWIALLDPRDAFHAAVREFNGTLGTVRLVTTDEVLAEVLTFFSRGGPIWRSKAAMMVRSTRSDPDVDVLPQTRADFDAALTLYEARPNKEYSLTDCRSMPCHEEPGSDRGTEQRSSFHPRRFHHFVCNPLNSPPGRMALLMVISRRPDRPRMNSGPSGPKQRTVDRAFVPGRPVPASSRPPIG
jgi:predicted nucleic acid-binding protein